MDPTWEVWIQSKSDTIKRFERLGLATIDVPIRPDELIRYCRQNRQPVDGKVRAALASIKTEEME